MRQSIKMPRILKINWIKELSISVVFNNGESRILEKQIHSTQANPNWLRGITIST
jgi:hypothetical protein